MFGYFGSEIQDYSSKSLYRSVTFKRDGLWLLKYSGEAQVRVVVSERATKINVKVLKTSNTINKNSSDNTTNPINKTHLSTTPSGFILKILPALNIDEIERFIGKEVSGKEAFLWCIRNSDCVDAYEIASGYTLPSGRKVQEEDIEGLLKAVNLIKSASLGSQLKALLFLAGCNSVKSSINSEPGSLQSFLTIISNRTGPLVIDIKQLKQITENNPFIKDDGKSIMLEFLSAIAAPSVELSQIRGNRINQLRPSLEDPDYLELAPVISDFTI